MISNSLIHEFTDQKIPKPQSNNKSNNLTNEYNEEYLYKLSKCKVQKAHNFTTYIKHIISHPTRYREWRKTYRCK